MTMQFEFHAYHDGLRADITTERLQSDSAARAKAGRMAKRCNGPVDLARAGAAPWDERYITTASPSQFHASGYRLERLA
ncbi:hypothetical protein CK222_21545 [Mesorhizobium sp. WSM3866]|uniref:hypothetical protein n=1 Tax=Mesorhizobium sp. WSM3866 TaxID=422271 RepID=UPI000BAF7110|nr:hypothetical protein [Mesorhizobium sp. WSM3866]PBB41743.1 hypothetical protein CK222_21545 [Mesorhizobium sp. WSM3866]